MTAKWSPDYICAMLNQLFVPELAKTSKTKQIPTNMDAIITFDAQGVSNHPNHKACFEGAQLFLDGLRKDRKGWDCPISIYTLTSVSLFRKYIWLVDNIFTMLTCAVAVFQGRRGARKGRRKATSERRSEYPSPLIYMNGMFAWNQAQRAMVNGHWSQMVWFRWGWIGLGRYLLVNDLRKL